MSRIHVTIDALALRGVPAADRRAVAAGLTGELTRLLAEPHMARRLAALGDVPRLRVGQPAAGAASDARRLGVDAARRIAAGIRR
jgi:hypothetical protein